jgi:signal transduction histidine kinase/ligand-binding sensor domain-containing protein
VSFAGIDWASVGRLRAVLEDHDGSLWVAGDKAVLRRTPDQRAVSYAMQAGGRQLKARCLLEVEPGTFWIGTNDTVMVLRAEPQHAARGLDARAFDNAKPCAAGTNAPRPAVCEYGSAIGNAGSLVRSLVRSPDGTIWIGAVNGVTTFDGTRFRTFDKANGLTNETINAITVDRAGSVWLGTDLGGAIRIGRSGMTSYTIADGLAATDVGQILEDPAGRLYVITLRRGFVHRFDGARFHLVDLDLRRPASSNVSSRTQAWWTDASVAQRVLAEPYDDKQAHIFAVFPDSKGDLWLGEHTEAHDNLLRWHHETGALQRFGTGHGVPTFDTGDTFDSTLVFTEDSHGGVWIGVVDGGVARFEDERFVWMRDSSGAPLRNMKDVSADREGHVWIASSDGIWRVVDPSAREPRATLVVPGSALGRIKCMTVDAGGRLYVGTPNGLEQVDPTTGRVIRHYSRADGLAHNEVLSAFRDRSGVLWFGTYEGVSRFIPAPDTVEPTPPVFVSAVYAAGRPVSVAELGATTVDGLTLPPDQRHIQIEFGGLPLGLGDPLRFQYRLVGADRDWSPAADTRSVSYAQLTRGAYRFEVRAVTASGIGSATPAVVAFRVLAPVWARWWFITGLLGLVAIAAHLTYRMRTARLVELERIRTRIAADLHDDIGANLSRIAMMSDVARVQAGGDGGRAGQLLESVASISRESVDAMSDIVWAVDPSRDRLKDLAQRMRRFASDVLIARDIVLTFRSPGSDLDWPLSADVRREVLLIFKEAVNNVARHSGATAATIDLAAAHGDLNVTVSDNGRGFDSVAGPNGNGLASMRRRAERLGGTLSVRATAGGTSVQLRVPGR